MALLAVLMASVVRRASRPLDNPDTYFHLRFGHEFLTTWSLSNPGSVSSYATASWLPTQWLPEVIMAWTEQSFGLSAVAWLSGLQVLGLVVTLYVVARHWAAPLPAVVVVSGAILACGPSLSMRPQVLSYVFVAIFTQLWMRTATSARLPWIVVPLSWIWAMTHGMWPIGIVIGLVAVACWSFDNPPSALGLLKRVAVPAAAGVAACLTPVGPGIYGAVLSVTSRSEYFSEWQPPDFTSPHCMALGAMLTMAIVTMMKQPRNAWLSIGLFVLAAAFSVYSIRTVPVAAVILVPVLSREIQRYVDDSGRPPLSRDLPAVTFMSVVSLVVLAVLVPHTASKSPYQPAWVDQELAALPNGTALLNEWGWGGYLMWRYPTLDLVMHGYGDNFTEPELKRNRDIANVEPGWDKQVEQLDVNYALLHPDSPLAYALRRHEGWHVIHTSEDMQLLRSPRSPDGGRRQVGDSLAR